MPPVVVSALAAGSLVVGFAVAQATGVRALGGLVLLTGAAVCAVLWQRRAGTARAAALVVLFAAAFVGSHLLAGVVSAWPAVLTVAAIVGAVSLVATSARAAPADRA